MEAQIKTNPKRILDFDVETVASGFADPNWVPQRITVIAWSWVGEDRVYHTTRLQGPHDMFRSFRYAYDRADMITGHNLIRFDLPVINADLMRVGLPTLGSKLVQDTIKLVKSKGFKKGQDNIGKLLELASKKQAMDWQDWEDAYQWDDLIAGKKVSWRKVISRCKSDVSMHKQMRDEMLERGWVLPAKTWKP